MTSPSNSEIQNLLPVQAYFNLDGSFNTFIGQGQPFYATPDPQQSGLQITNSTINSSVIGGITPAAANFTTATVLAQPVGATDVVNLLALQSYAAGISWKQPCVTATLANITLSGLQTIDGKAVAAGDRVLVKNQSTAANNGIYLASASAWSRSEDANTWDELICAITFIEYGTQAGGAWFCTAQDGGTLGVTAVNWSQFTTSATYSAGTGLTLTGQVFSITPVGTASTYGSASTVPVFTTNASGQVSSVTNTNIAIAATQITSGTIDSARLSGSYSGITGLGTLTNLTVTNAIVGSITGNAATATSATTATNIAGGAVGSVPYQTGSNATGFLAAGSNGQVLTLASGVPSWATPTTGTVTSVSGTAPIVSSGGNTPAISIPVATAIANGYLSSTDWTTFNNKSNTNGTVTSVGGTGTVNGLTLTGTVTTSGNLTLGGTLDLSAPPAIGGTTPAAGTFTTLRVNSTISLAGSTGTSGYVLTSNGASAPTWSALPATGITITDDTTTNATRYLAFTSATSGSITGQNVSSTKLQFNPSTGFLASTGTIVGAGTVSSPSITTTGDTNTGIFFPAADTIAFTEGGVESMRISSAGDVFVGGTAAAVLGYEKFSAYGTGSFKTASANALGLWNTANAGLVQFYTGGGIDAGNINATSGALTITSGTNLNLTAPSTNFITLNTNSAERFRVGSAGQLGVAGANYGTSGQVLTSGGASAAPTWSDVSGGQYFGTAAVKAIAYNANTIAENITVTTGNNGLSAGPITISSTFTVTVQTGAVWVIV